MKLAVILVASADHVFAADLAHVELYSCFPCVSKMARRTLGMSADEPLTIAGGLTFFGAPLNNYMTHAVAAAVRRLRRTEDTGLLYGQGEFVTKHHGLVLSGRAPAKALAHDIEVQDEADKRTGPVPSFREDLTPGGAELESSSVAFDREGRITQAVVILRRETTRTLARVALHDAPTLSALTGNDTPVGLGGDLRSGADGVGVWSVRRW